MESEECVEECCEPGHMVYSNVIPLNEAEKRTNRVLSKPLTPKSHLEELRFYSRPETWRRKYNLLMLEIEDREPKVYEAMISLGLPSPYRKR